MSEPGPVKRRVPEMPNWVPRWVDVVLDSWHIVLIVALVAVVAWFAVGPGAKDDSSQPGCVTPDSSSCDPIDQGDYEVYR